MSACAIAGQDFWSVDEVIGTSLAVSKGVSRRYPSNMVRVIGERLSMSFSLGQSEDAKMYLMIRVPRVRRQTYGSIRIA